MNEIQERKDAMPGIPTGSSNSNALCQTTQSTAVTSDQTTTAASGTTHRRIPVSVENANSLPLQSQTQFPATRPSDNVVWHTVVERTDAMELDESPSPTTESVTWKMEIDLERGPRVGATRRERLEPETQSDVQFEDTNPPKRTRNFAPREALDTDDDFRADDDCADDDNPDHKVYRELLDLIFECDDESSDSGEESLDSIDDTVYSNNNNVGPGAFSKSEADQMVQDGKVCEGFDARSEASGADVILEKILLLASPAVSCDRPTEQEVLTLVGRFVEKQAADVKAIDALVEAGRRGDAQALGQAVLLARKLLVGASQAFSAHGVLKTLPLGRKLDERLSTGLHHAVEAAEAAATKVAKKVRSTIKFAGWQGDERFLNGRQLIKGISTKLGVVQSDELERLTAKLSLKKMKGRVLTLVNTHLREAKLQYDAAVSNGAGSPYDKLKNNMFRKCFGSNGIATSLQSEVAYANVGNLLVMEGQSISRSVEEMIDEFRRDPATHTYLLGHLDDVLKNAL